MLSRRAALLLFLPLAAVPAVRAQGTGFSRLSQRLSEPGGYFDSDNLVSNETSYLHVIGALRLREKHWTVSAFYTSNVEQDLCRFGTFNAFVANVRALPADSSSVIIRSWFIRGGGFQATAPGHLSAQQLHPLAKFLARSNPPDPFNVMVGYGRLTDDAEDMIPTAPAVPQSTP